jgi:hypothetical protein
MRVTRMMYGSLLRVDEDMSSIGSVIAHQALDERALAGAVLTQQRMYAASAKFDSHLIERAQKPKGLAEVDNFDLGRRGLL